MMKKDQYRGIRLWLFGLLMVLALARLVWFEEVGGPMDETFVFLIVFGVLVLLVRWENLRFVKAAGIELSLDNPEVEGAVQGLLDLEETEQEELRNQLMGLSKELVSLRGSRILWIDDKPHEIMGARRMLRALGAEIVPATASEMAEEFLNRDNDFDLVITDVQRRGESHKLVGGVDIHEGVNFIVKLRRHSDSAIRALPVVFYAAYDWERLVKFTRSAREILPEPQICNSFQGLLDKVIESVAKGRANPIAVPSMKKPTSVA